MNEPAILTVLIAMLGLALEVAIMMPSVRM
jgi:hypothetical protein